jgi:hypothetical protein
VDWTAIKQELDHEFAAPAELTCCPVLISEHRWVVVVIWHGLGRVGFFDAASVQPNRQPNGQVNCSNYTT